MGFFSFIFFVIYLFEFVMTFNPGHEDLRLEGDYVTLEAGGGRSGDGGARLLKETPRGGGRGELWWLLWWWAKLVLVVLLVVVLLAVFLKWVGPFFMDKVIFFPPRLNTYLCVCVCVFCVSVFVGI